MKIVLQIFLPLLLLKPLISSGQNDCGDRKIDTIPGAIFGPDLLLIYGADTIITEKNEQVIYSCKHCAITCKDSGGKVKWTKDLSKLNCRIISFGKIQKNIVKGYDIYMQFKNKSIYGLKSKNGK